MERAPSLTFGPFRLEIAQARLWRGNQRIPLRPRSFAMLRYFAEHPGRLVNKAELRQQVWAGTHVTDTVIRVCVREIRAALGDSAAVPQYLETVGRQGYRFLASGDGSTPCLAASGSLVGRQHEVETLETYFQRAAQGQRQLVFISGEAGIGKTTVVDLLLARLITGNAMWLGRGQCVEHYGEGEPYLPLLEAFGRLGRGPEGAEVLAVLRRYAPMWLVQLPGLVREAELERLQRQVQGATPARMIRELAEALEELTADRTLVLVLEDLHWSDPSTIEFLTYLAQRREPARLLVLGTYRPVEVVLRAHPVRGMVQELYGRRQGVELGLEFLSAVDVAAYVAGRLGAPVAPPLAAFIHERTEGNALFMVNLLEHLVQQRLLVRHAGQWTLRQGVEAGVVSLPEELRQLLSRRIEPLPPEAQRVLQAASVAGEEFATAAVADGLQSAVEDVETICEELAAHYGFIDEVGLAEWPDGSVSGRYRFQHALYQQVLYERLGQTRRAQLHRRIGARLEAGYGVRAGDIAAQLAVHYERGGEVQRAIHSLRLAAENAARRNAYQAAIALCTRGLALLATLPDNPERTQHELMLQLLLGDLLTASKGLAAPETAAAYTRARALCQQVEEAPQLVRALQGLYRFHGTRAQWRTAAELAREVFRLTQQQHDPYLVLEGHWALGAVALYRGDPGTARVHLEHSLHLCDMRQPATSSFHGGLAPLVTTLSLLAQTLWVLGYADQARQRCQGALAVARQVEHSPSLAFVELYATLLPQQCRDVLATQVHAEALMALAAAQGFGYRVEQGRILRGWVLAMRGDTAPGAAHILQGLAAHRDVGPKLLRSYFLALLSEVHGRAGQPEAGLAVLDEALTLMTTTDERWWEAELYRLRGALLQQAAGSVRHGALTPETCFRKAIDIARKQQARTLELRAVLSLSRLWRAQGKYEQARQILADIYGWFTEGHATCDLQEAQVLLQELG